MYLRRTRPGVFDSPLLAPPRGGVDERLEELHVLARLRMPEDAEREAPIRRLHGLDRPVLGVRRDPEALAEPAEALVVVGLHRRAIAEQRLQPRPALDRHVVVGEGA